MRRGNEPQTDVGRGPAGIWQGFLSVGAILGLTVASPLRHWRGRRRAAAGPRVEPGHVGRLEGAVSELGPENNLALAVSPQLQRVGVPDPYRVALRVLPIVLLHGLWSAFVVLVHYGTGGRLVMPTWVHPLLGGVLGLLLAFRTNQAYERHWSSCKAWVELHQIILGMERIASQLPAGLSCYTSIMRHLVAFPIALKQHLRGMRDPREYIGVLGLAELDIVARSPSPHSAILTSLTMLMRPLLSRDDGTGKRLSLWSQLEDGLKKLQAVACSCDGMLSLPMPASYSLHTARFLLLWVSTLPFALVGHMHPVVVPPTMICVAWALYSTEELAQLMEEPFGSELTPETIPLDAFCRRILTEVTQQAYTNGILEQRVAAGSWVVQPQDLAERKAGAEDWQDVAAADAEAVQADARVAASWRVMQESALDVTDANEDEDDDPAASGQGGSL